MKERTRQIIVQIMWLCVMGLYVRVSWDFSDPTYVRNFLGAFVWGAAPAGANAIYFATKGGHKRHLLGFVFWALLGTIIFVQIPTFRSIAPAGFILACVLVGFSRWRFGSESAVPTEA